ncbi:GntR family transcriptional regulator [Ancylobacter mangrovi]|uniref:GntR family transcriptional regulator n=1 Tax=Ancylobacter mangrovi TaxID=2972472 RepID=A0A9X2PEH5_9HYPH|nr:GntR family transcriptional regulator [Ancylobacter mangrovi]MCS0497231.1 GntR family transcriptional regulator [Ancylobacter mangrovi]MCS0505056.1 GntR family transcriptional regulator [Ancylobacter mangrovi]
MPSAGIKRVSKSDAQKSSTSRGRRPRDKDDEDLTLTDRAYRELEELISTLQLPPGTVLAELTLANRLGIGRTPIREALQRLARDGLVIVLPRRGILVSEINLRTQLRLLETRRVLERLIAELAAERASEEERAAFDEIARGMREAAERSDGIEFMRYDRELNTLAAEAARNEFAARSMGLMHALSRRFWYQHYKRVADLPLAANLHAELAAAIARGDRAGAAAASDRLMDYIESFARKTLDD